MHPQRGSTAEAGQDGGPSSTPGGLTRPPGQEELSPGLPRVPPVGPLLKGPVALASQTGVEGGCRVCPLALHSCRWEMRGHQGRVSPGTTCFTQHPECEEAGSPSTPPTCLSWPLSAVTSTPSPSIRTPSEGSTAPDLCLQGWTHGRARAQSDAKEKERRGQVGKGGGGL